MCRLAGLVTKKDYLSLVISFYVYYIDKRERENKKNSSPPPKKKVSPNLLAFASARNSVSISNSSGTRDLWRYQLSRWILFKNITTKLIVNKYQFKLYSHFTAISTRDDSYCTSFKWKECE